MKQKINVQYSLFKARKDFRLTWKDYIFYIFAFLLIGGMISVKEMNVLEKVAMFVWYITMFSLGYSFRGLRDLHKKNKTVYDFSEEQYDKEMEIWSKVLSVKEDDICIKNIITKQTAMVSYWKKPTFIAYAMPDEMKREDITDLVRCRDQYDLLNLGWVVD